MNDIADLVKELEARVACFQFNQCVTHALTLIAKPENKNQKTARVR